MENEKWKIENAECETTAFCNFNFSFLIFHFLKQARHTHLLRTKTYWSSSRAGVPVTSAIKLFPLPLFQWLPLEPLLFQPRF